MAFSFIGSANAAATGATEVDGVVPAGVAAGQIIVALFAFEGVAAGSGPWIIPNSGQFTSDFIGPVTAWQQLCWQSPSLAGVGIEVWGAIYSSGAFLKAKFAAAQNAVMVAGAWSGEYNPGSSIVAAPPRLAPTAQVTGDQPAAPSVQANAGELIVALAGDLMGAGGFGTPSGKTSRVDATRAGAGTVEAVIADYTPTVAGATGPITFPNPAAAATTRGTTATLAIVPAPTGSSTGPILDVPMPADLDLGDGWTLRVTALNPVTGAVVPGVTVSSFAMEVELGAGTSAVDLETGDYKLVPGPGA